MGTREGYSLPTLYTTTTLGTSNLVVSSGGGYIGTLGGIEIYTSDNLQGNNNKGMKIGKRDVYKIVLRETIITDYTYELLAENKEEALKLIEENRCDSSTNLVSVDVTEVE